MILAYLTDNPNTPDNDKDTPINEAAHKGHTEIIKILAPLTDNPNDSMYDGTTTMNGHTEIVKILADVTAQPNVSDEY